MTGNCELCYECIDCDQCYNCAFLHNCTNCRDSKFLYSCQNCKDCFGCVNLYNKQYCWFNEQLTKADFGKRIAEFYTGSYQAVEEVKRLMQEKVLQFPMRLMLGTNNQNVSGDSISQSKNTHYCFNAAQLENCKYCVFFHDAKDCMDIFAWGSTAELCYYSMEVGGDAYQNLFCATCFSSKNIIYCFQCHYCSDCFGCSGLKRQQYCIFNKQYTKDAYEALVPQIIAHMCNPVLHTGPEWGEFFPIAFSGFGYNETIAYEQFPSDKASILAQGGLWRDELPIVATDKSYVLSDSVYDQDDEVLKKILSCQSCHKSYRIIQQELLFYRKQSLPIPRECFYCRHLARIAKRNSHKLWDRNCAQCNVAIKTAIDPEAKRTVYCADCYQKLVY